MRGYFQTIRNLGCIALLLLLMASLSHGAIMWTMDNAVQQNGFQATGSFVYDAGSNTYSSINIQLNGITYDALLSGDQDEARFVESTAFPD